MERIDSIDCMEYGMIPKMNELEFYLSLERNNRQSGRTTVLAKTCLEIDGIFVVHSEDMKRIIEKQYPGLKVIAMHQRHSLIGTNKPVILDHLVWEQLMIGQTTEIKQVRAEIQAYKRQLKRIKTFVDQMEM